MRKEVKVGLLVVISGAMLYLGFNFMKGKDFFTTSNRFEVVYPNVDGLTEASPVKYKGAIVGQVQYLEMIYDENPGAMSFDSVLVSIMVDPQVRVNDKTVALLKSSGPFDGNAIYLELGQSPNLLFSGSRLKAEWEEGLVDQLMNAINPTIESTEKIMKEIKAILDTSAQQNLGIIMQNFADASGSVKRTAKSVENIVAGSSKNITDITKKVNGLTDSTALLLAELKPIITKISAIADTLNNAEVTALVNNLNSTVSGLNEVVQKINDGNGSLGKLVNEKELYDNLNATILALNGTLIKLNNRPKDLIGPLGKKNQKFILDTVKIPHLLIEK